MRTVGGYSTVGLRIMPPISSEPAPEDVETDAQFETTQEFETTPERDELELLDERELAVAAGSRAK